jgi:hypothetical protein
LDALSSEPDSDAADLLNRPGHSDDRDHLFRSIATSVARVLTAPLDDGVVMSVS